MSTYNAVTLAAYLNKQKLGDNSPVTYRDKIDTAKKHGLINEYGQRIFLIEKQIYAASSGRLHSALEWRKLDNTINKNIAHLSITEIGKNTRHYSGLIDRQITESKKIRDAFAIPNNQYIDGIMKLAAGATGRGASIGRQELFKAVINTNPFEGSRDPKAWKLGRVDNFSAQHELLERVNGLHMDAGYEPIFELDPVTKAISNIDELRGPNSRLVSEGLLDKTVHAQMFEYDSNQLSNYNAHADSIARNLENIDGVIADAQANRDKMDDPDLSVAGIAEAYKTAAGSLKSIEEAAERGNHFDIKNMQQLNEELANLKVLKDQRKLLIGQQAELIKTKPTAAEKLKQEMAHTISSPAFHAWAADHGFDELGRVDGDENNMLLVDTYVQGRDDLAAMRTFYREQKRGAGRYGFRSIGTGEIVQVTIDGKTIVGERLKYHAADRVGVVRIATPDRDDPILVVSPGDVAQIEIIETDEDRASPQALKARALLYRRGGAIEAARKRAQGDPALGIGDAAQVEGQFVVDASGRNLSSAEYQQLVDETAASGLVTAKVVGDNTYLVNAEGQVYRVDAGELVPLDADSEDTLVSKEIFDVQEAPPRRVVAVEIDPTTGKRVGRPVTAEDLASGGTFFPEPGEGDSGYTDKTSADFDSVEAQRIASITPGSLNLNLSPDFSGAAGQTFGDEHSVGGMKFVTLKSPTPRVTVTPEPVVEVSEADAMNQARLDALTPDQQNDIAGWTAKYTAAPAGQKPDPPEGYEVVPGEGLRPIATDTIEKLESDALTAVGPRGAKPVLFDTETPIPEVPDKDTSGLTDEQKSIIRTWTTQAREANLEGKPGKPIPEGYEMVHGEGLRPISAPAAKPAAKPPAKPAAKTGAEPELDLTGVDLDAINVEPSSAAAAKTVDFKKIEEDRSKRWADLAAALNRLKNEVKTRRDEVVTRPDEVETDGTNKVTAPLVPTKNMIPAETPKSPPPPDEVAAKKAMLADRLKRMRDGSARGVDFSGSPVPDVTGAQ